METMYFTGYLSRYCWLFKAKVEGLIEAVVNWLVAA